MALFLVGRTARRAGWRRKSSTGPLGELRAGSGRGAKQSRDWTNRSRKAGRAEFVARGARGGRRSWRPRPGGGVGLVEDVVHVGVHGRVLRTSSSAMSRSLRPRAMRRNTCSINGRMPSGDGQRLVQQGHGLLMVTRFIGLEQGFGMVMAGPC